MQKKPRWRTAHGKSISDDTQDEKERRIPWVMQESNLRPLPCEGSALAAAPITLNRRHLEFRRRHSRIASASVGDTRFELVTPSVSGKCATTAPTARVMLTWMKPMESIASRKRWVRESNSSIRLCRPLPNRLANPPIGRQLFRTSSGQRDLNPRSRPWQGRALPTKLCPQCFRPFPWPKHESLL